MADAMESGRQDMEQEAADILVGGKRHDLLTVGTGTTIVLVAQGHASRVEGR
jgi:hypothetical protein